MNHNLQLAAVTAATQIIRDSRGRIEDCHDFTQLVREAHIGRTDAEVDETTDEGRQALQEAGDLAQALCRLAAAAIDHAMKGS